MQCRDFYGLDHHIAIALHCIANTPGLCHKDITSRHNSAVLCTGLWSLVSGLWSLVWCAELCGEEEGREGSSSSKDLYYRASKEISGLSSGLTERNSRLDMEVHQAVLSLLDVVTAYSEMMVRHEKGLLKEHKIAAEKIGMIKVRDLRGALATDIEMRNLLETNIQENEIVLTDLESRQVLSSIQHDDIFLFYLQAFSLLCLHNEGKLILKFASVFVKILASFAEIQFNSSCHQNEIWKNVNQIF